MIRIVTMFPSNGAKFENVVIDAIKLTLLNYTNLSIVKLVANKLERVKSNLSRLQTNTKLILNKLVLIKSIQKD